MWRVERDIGETYGLVPNAFIFPAYLLSWIGNDIDDPAFSRDGQVTEFSTRYGFNFDYRYAVLPFIMGLGENHWGVQVFDFAEKVSPLC